MCYIFFFCISFFFFLLLGFFFFFFIYGCVWVFVSVRGLSPVVASGGHSSSQCAGLSVLRPLLLRSTGSRRAGSVVVAHGPSRSAACGILRDQGLNPCPLHWQADSQPLATREARNPPFNSPEITNAFNKSRNLFSRKTQWSATEILDFEP